MNYCFRFSGEDSELQGFVDADWANSVVDRKSYTGFAFKLCGSVVSWESTKQKTVALSSTEAEYMSISEAAKEASTKVLALIWKMGIRTWVWVQV